MHRDASGAGAGCIASGDVHERASRHPGNLANADAAHTSKRRLGKEALVVQPRSRCVIAALFGGIVLFLGSAARAAPLEIIVTNVRSDSGQVAVCLFSGARRFPDCAAGERLATAVQPAQRGAMRFAFDVPPAVIAAAVVHDENANGQLDTNLIGIPREGVGVSNNPAPRRGPPLHQEAAFTLLPAGGTIRIELLYP